jgi:hypothetical protein
MPSAIIRPEASSMSDSTARVPSGVTPAIANAVYHATGKRIRDLPITIEKLL